MVIHLVIHPNRGGKIQNYPKNTAFSGYLSILFDVWTFFFTNFVGQAGCPKKSLVGELFPLPARPFVKSFVNQKLGGGSLLKIIIQDENIGLMFDVEKIFRNKCHQSE